MKKYFLLFLIVVIYGCSDSSTNSNTQPTPSLSIGQAPKAGSWYKFTDVPIDTNGTLMPGNAYWEIDSVVQSDLTIFGKSNVILVSTTTQLNNVPDSTYFSFESNGDVSMIALNSGSINWLTLPFASKTLTIHYTDTIINGIQAITADTIENIGTETFFVNGAQLTASKIRLSTYSKSVILGTEYVLYSTSTMGFCSSIGYFIHLNIAPQKIGQFSLTGDDLTLVSYVVKE